MLEFYHHPLSPFSNRIHLLLEELNLPYEMKTVALEKGEQRSPQFLKINPFGRVPVISEDHFNLSESGAILKFLIEKNRRFDLYPINLQERAVVDQWLEFANSHICDQLSELAWHRYQCHKFKMPADENVISRAEKELKRDFPALDRHLMGRNYIAGHEFTVADLNLMPFMHLCRAAQWNLDFFPSVQRWWNNVSQRSSWKKLNANLT